MNSVISQSPTPDRAALLKVTSQACGALSTLLEDKQFHSDLFRLTETAASSHQQREQLKRELDLFNIQFLRIEEKALLAAGLEERAAKEILWSAAMFRMSIDTKFDSEQVLDSIARLRSDVCDGSQRLQAEMDSSERRSLVRKWSFRIGGVALIVVDLGSPAILAPPVATGSVLVGAAISSWTE